MTFERVPRPRYGDGKLISPGAPRSNLTVALTHPARKTAAPSLSDGVRLGVGALRTSRDPAARKRTIPRVYTQHATRRTSLIDPRRRQRAIRLGRAGYVDRGFAKAPRRLAPPRRPPPAILPPAARRPEVTHRRPGPSLARPVAVRAARPCEGRTCADRASARSPRIESRDARRGSPSRGVAFAGVYVPIDDR